MTTILYKTPYLASDSGVFVNTMLMDRMDDKIGLINDRYFYGATGGLADVILVREFLLDQTWKDTTLIYLREDFINLSLQFPDEFEALIVEKGTLNRWTLDRAGVWLKVNSDVVALGAGREFAFGALLGGCSLGTTLSLLEKHNGFVRGPFHIANCETGEKVTHD